MNPLEQVNNYLRLIERRLRWSALSRGIAYLASIALVCTVLLVLYTNSYAFSPASLLIARIVLFLALALVLAFALFVPLLRLNRRRAARRAEEFYPSFEERLLTFAESKTENPLMELLASDTVEVAGHASPETVVGNRWLFGPLSAALVSAAVLLWLIFAGPGFLGHGASLLWAGTPKGGLQAFYDILISPGDRAVRRNSDQPITAQTVGFQSQRAILHARFEGTTKWEQAPMMVAPGGSSHQFLFAALPSNVEYYVEAGGVRSKTHKLSVIDLPAIRKMRVTYKYPSWAGLQNAVDESSADLRAVEGTQAEVAILFDRPLKQGALVLDDGRRLPVARREGNWVAATVPIEKDGMYHVAAIEQGQDVRLSEDFFIEAQKETPPAIHIARPDRDFKANPIEEVSVAVEAEDDFALQEMNLHYSVNGGPEKVVPLLGRRGVKKGAGETLIALEDFKLVPGDVVSLYASARDARSTTKTDIAFIEAQPFEKEYQQAQTMGMGGGGGDPQEQISQRQKEIIAATFNQIRDRSGDKGAAAENARFLSEIQSKLRDQAQSLARRMRARQLSGASQEFQAFANDMEKAAQAMTESAGKLKQQKWQEALAPQQKSLQGLLRAESTFRQIQVAFGRQGGGGGGGGAGRDLESLFDLELDTEKNQYETGQQTASADDRQREVDEALQKLEQLARRQQELARQRDQKNQTPQQRWQQEMLRREAEQLQKRMQELAQGNRSQSSSQQQGSQSSSQSSQGSQSGQQMSGRGGQSDPRLQRAIERLQRASDDMRRAASPQAGLPQQGAAEARRAADRLQEARDALRGMQAQNSGRQIDQLAGRAEQLAAQQRDFAERLKKAFPNNQSPPSMFNRQPGQSAQQAEQFASEKERMAEELARLEREMHSAARNMQGSERGASSKLRDALGQMQQDELLLRMRFNAGYIRQGWGGMLGGRETQITAGMDKLRDQIKQAQKALGPGDEGNNTELEKALARVERLREQLERATGARDGRDQQGRQGQGRQGQQQAQSGAQGEQGGPQGRQGQPGQQGQRGQQPGQGREGERGVESGRQYGGGPRSPYGIQGIYRSPDWIPGQGPTRNADPEQAYREGVRELSQLRQQLRDDADLSRDLQELMREMQRFEAGKLAGNPIILQQMRSELIPAIEQLELQLRRKLDQQSGGDVRSSTAERIPPGYAQAVAEYYKRLSKGK